MFIIERHIHRLIVIPERVAKTSHQGMDESRRSEFEKPDIIDLETPGLSRLLELKERTRADDKLGSTDDDRTKFTDVCRGGHDPIGDRDLRLVSVLTDVKNRSIESGQVHLFCLETEIGFHFLIREMLMSC